MKTKTPLWLTIILALATALIGRLTGTDTPDIILKSPVSTVQIQYRDTCIQHIIDSMDVYGKVREGILQKHKVKPVITDVFTNNKENRVDWLEEQSPNAIVVDDNDPVVHSSDLDGSPAFVDKNYFIPYVDSLLEVVTTFNLNGLYCEIKDIEVQVKLDTPIIYRDTYIQYPVSTTPILPAPKYTIPRFTNRSIYVEGFFTIPWGYGVGALYKDKRGTLMGIDYQINNKTIGFSVMSPVFDW